MDCISSETARLVVRPSSSIGQSPLTSCGLFVFVFGSEGKENTRQLLLFDHLVLLIHSLIVNQTAS